MRVLLLTDDRKTAQIYAKAAEETEMLRLFSLKNTAQVLERLFRDPFDALLSEDESVLLSEIRNCPVPWPGLLFLLSDRTISDKHLPEYLTFCFPKDSDPHYVLERIARFPKEAGRKIRTETRIPLFLQHIGIPAFLNGFNYLEIAVRLMLAQETTLDVRSINDIYAVISALSGVSANVAEHAIRHAIDAAWMRADTGTLERLFGYTVRPDRGAPSNAAFLFRAADHIKMTEEGEIK